MEILQKLVYAAMLLSAVGIVGLVLLQHGKGADMGTGFGAGSSGSLFGATGSANFLSRTTAVLAAVFFICTLALAHFATNRPKASGGVMEGVTTKVPAQPALPASGVPVDTAPGPGVAPAGASGVPAAVPVVPAKPTDVPK